MPQFCGLRPLPAAKKGIPDVLDMDAVKAAPFVESCALQNEARADRLVSVFACIIFHVRK